MGLETDLTAFLRRKQGLRKLGQQKISSELPLWVKCFHVVWPKHRAFPESLHPTWPVAWLWIFFSCAVNPGRQLIFSLCCYTKVIKEDHIENQCREFTWMAMLLITSRKIRSELGQSTSRVYWVPTICQTTTIWDTLPPFLKTLWFCDTMIFSPRSLRKLVPGIYVQVGLIQSLDGLNGN